MVRNGFRPSTGTLQTKPHADRSVDPRGSERIDRYGRRRVPSWALRRPSSWALRAPLLDLDELRVKRCLGGAGLGGVRGWGWFEVGGGGVGVWGLGD